MFLARSKKARCIENEYGEMTRPNVTEYQASMGGALSGMDAGDVEATCNDPPFVEIALGKGKRANT